MRTVAEYVTIENKSSSQSMSIAWVTARTVTSHLCPFMLLLVSTTSVTLTGVRRLPVPGIAAVGAVGESIEQLQQEAIGSTLCSKLQSV